MSCLLYIVCLAMKRRALLEEVLISKRRQSSIKKHYPKRHVAIFKSSNSKKRCLNSLFKSLQVDEKEDFLLPASASATSFSSSSSSPSSSTPNTILSFMKESSRFDYYQSLKLLQVFLPNATKELMSNINDKWDVLVNPITSYIYSNTQLTNMQQVDQWLTDLEVAEAAACAIKEESGKWENEIINIRTKVSEVLLKI